MRIGTLIKVTECFIVIKKFEGPRGAGLLFLAFFIWGGTEKSFWGTRSEYFKAVQKFDLLLFLSVYS